MRRGGRLLTLLAPRVSVEASRPQVTSMIAPRPFRLRMHLVLLAAVLVCAPAWAIAQPTGTGPATESRFPHLVVPQGFKATLFACDPFVEYLSAVALGPR